MVKVLNFKTASQNNLHYTVRGEFQTYTGDGYVADMYPTQIDAQIAQERNTNNSDLGLGHPSTK